MGREAEREREAMGCLADEAEQQALRAGDRGEAARQVSIRKVKGASGEEQARRGVVGERQGERWMKSVGKRSQWRKAQKRMKDEVRGCGVLAAQKQQRPHMMCHKRQHLSVHRCLPQRNLALMGKRSRLGSLPCDDGNDGYVSGKVEQSQFGSRWLSGHSRHTVVSSFQIQLQLAAHSRDDRERCRSDRLGRGCQTAIAGRSSLAFRRELVVHHLQHHCNEC